MPTSVSPRVTFLVSMGELSGVPWPFSLGRQEEGRALFSKAAGVILPSGAKTSMQSVTAFGSVLSGPSALRLGVEIGLARSSQHIIAKTVVTE